MIDSSFSGRGWTVFHKWSPVIALALCAGTLVASEFMPASLLTPIASDLQLTDGQTGRAISISGIFAVLTSLSVSSLTRGIDRRHLLLLMVGLMLVADLMVGLAPNAATFMAGRALIGVVIGAFWSMSAATVMRLVPVADVPKGLALVNGGNALVVTIATPLGSFLGQYTGWRGVFFLLLVPLSVLAFAWLFRFLPSMPSERTAGGGSVFRVLRQRQVALGMLGVMIFFLGQFSLATYLRPFLETVTQVSTSTFSLIQLVMGLMGLLGNVLIGMLLRTRLYSLLMVIPLMLATIALSLTVFGGLPLVAGVLLSVWGLIGSSAAAVWWTWLSKVLPHDAEAGGGLMVAVIQLAVTAGATVGGVLYDQGGHQSTFTLSALALCAAAFIVLLAWRAGRREWEYLKEVKS
jgi:predicted MFS family arabinose efflux permease